MAATTEDRPYSSEDRPYVHDVDNTKEEGSAIAHSNTESNREETEQPGHYDTNRISPVRTEYGSRCTQQDGKKAGLCTECGESRRDITNSRTENTRYNFRTDCSGALRKNLETILRQKEERERNARKRDSTSPPVHEEHRIDLKRDEKKRLEVTTRRGYKYCTEEENFPGRELLQAWRKYVGVKNISAAILRNQKNERVT
ncbi:uncharacterized protein MONOS_15611 [Monocercomonoides exilis]|uniref:uncharacterized protein n=1 Tax=Monocercomonoides exilis TaxID=2049356 RepID=UPI003559C98E|nr:hypothetical protein MONOS_15611 [Monocercomonoides exilis]|eukprot:MONOS_15611.1-p1 / transcript=MONOS_15611.1 / gene=MONOS_15611 / organism=Monocercomonoides_exilis_PA203 / gene_product=unspecified product / transcript_product=unspecified product / location=Mono_scaffold01287:10450-11049(-) / protein_length=200 / sequence_SO=supercontig / SO=protein_coding / is_pseudo=false